MVCAMGTGQGMFKSLLHVQPMRLRCADNPTASQTLDQ